MLSILDEAPDFKARAVRGRRGALVEEEVSLGALGGAWALLLFYPKDFTRICPTEVTALSKRSHELRALSTEPFALSGDDLATHRRWIEEVLGEVEVPLCADPGGAVARAYWAWRASEGIAERATVLVDPARRVRYLAVHDLTVGRSVSELLRVVEALRTGEHAPAEWRPGQPTLGR